MAKLGRVTAMQKRARRKNIAIARAMRSKSLRAKKTSAAREQIRGRAFRMKILKAAKQRD